MVPTDTLEEIATATQTASRTVTAMVLLPTVTQAEEVATAEEEAASVVLVETKCLSWEPT